MQGTTRRLGRSVRCAGLCIDCLARRLVAMMPRLRSFALGLLLVVAGIGCQFEEPLDLDPPAGWQMDGTRWWKTGIDTSTAFRDLETLAVMNVTGAEVTYLASPQVARIRGGVQEQFERRVKRSLLPLYRNEPAVVDSLFEQYVTPVLQQVSPEADLEPLITEYKRKGYKLIHSHFREPAMSSRLGEDVPVSYPDSLRDYEGRVHVQAYLNDEGEPVAVKLLEGLHPVLDRIALRASTQARWRPAYLLRKGRWVARPSWTRFSIRFTSS